MCNCNATFTPWETGAKLRKEINDNFVSATLYKQIIRSLKYLCNTMPNTCQSVRLLSRFMEKPKECHLKVVKRVLRYIKGTIDHGVLMPRKKRLAQMQIYMATLIQILVEIKTKRRVLKATYSLFEVPQSYGVQESKAL